MSTSSQKQLNPGPLCAARGAELISFGFRHKASDDPDFLWQCDSNAVLSVVKDATTGGTYTVQFNQAYPREVVSGMAQLHQAAADLDSFRVVLDLDSYDADAGTIDIQCRSDDGDGTETIEQPADNTPVTVFMFVQRVNALVTDHE
jgi:hypothetical protein